MKINVKNQRGKKIVYCETTDYNGNHITMRFEPSTTGTHLNITKNQRKILEVSVSKQALQTILDCFQ